MTCQPDDFGFGIAAGVLAVCFLFFMLLVFGAVKFNSGDPEQRALRKWNRRVAKEAKHYLGLGIHPEEAFRIAAHELLRQSSELAKEIRSSSE